MRTVNFQTGVLHPTAFKVGLDPVRDFQSNQMAAMIVFINLWVRRLWDKADFPEWTLIEERMPTNHIVGYDQANQTPLGRVLKVFLIDPRTSNAAPVDTPFTLQDQGVHCGYDHGATVWIRFIKREPQFTGELWDSSSTYSVGDLVYVPDTIGGDGECYASLADTNLNNFPVGDTTNWSLVPFPQALANQVVRGAYSDMLRTEGQTDKGQVEEQGALGEMSETLQAKIAPPYDSLTDQQPAQVPRYRGAG
jgi:hypothetical protein